MRPDGAVFTSNLSAALRTVEPLGLEPRHAALREAVLHLANAVDADPGNASLWREYRGALRDLMEATDGGDDGFSVDSLLAQMGDASDAGPA